jgi:hypothetical protein
MRCFRDRRPSKRRLLHARLWHCSFGDRHAPGSPFPPPVCSDCGARMRYAVIKPSKVQPQARNLVGGRVRNHRGANAA